MSDNRIRDFMNLLDAMGNMYREHEDKIDDMLAVNNPAREAQFDKDKDRLIITAETQVETPGDIEVDYNYTDNTLTIINKSNSFGVDIPDGYRPIFDGEVKVNNGVAEIKFPVTKQDNTEDN